MGVVSSFNCLLCSVSISLLIQDNLFNFVNVFPVLCFLKFVSKIISICLFILVTMVLASNVISSYLILFLDCQIQKK